MSRIIPATSVLGRLLSRVEGVLERAIEPSDPEEAISLQESRVSWTSRHYGPRDPRTLGERMKYAIKLYGAGRGEGAVSELAEVVALLDRAGLSGEELKKRSRMEDEGFSDRELRRGARLRLGGALRELKRYDESEREFRRLIEQCENDPDAVDDETMQAFLAHAVVLCYLGRYSEAVAETARVVTHRTTSKGAIDKSTLEARGMHAAALLDAERYTELETETRSVIADFTRVYGPDHKYTLRAAERNAIALYNIDRPSDAAKKLEELAVTRERVLGPDHDDTRRARRFLDEVNRELEQKGRRDEGRHT